MRTNRRPVHEPTPPLRSPGVPEGLDPDHPFAVLYMGPLLGRLDALAARVEQLERQRPVLVAVGGGRVDESAPRRARGSAPSPNVCRREGEYWQVSYAGVTTRLRDTKGLGYIARLLAEPGRDVHVADLASGGAGVAASTRPHGGATRASHLGAVLDPRAMSEYRARLAELREEIDDGIEAGDAGRTERARQEMELIARALSAAYGIGGRARTAGDPADRIRKAVTIQIHRTRERIGAVHAPLGRHLANALRTGFVCSYRPERPVEWRL